MKIMIGNHASYLSIKDFDESMKPISTKEIDDSGIYADYDCNGELIGIELITEVEVEYYEDYRKHDNIE